MALVFLVEAWDTSWWKEEICRLDPSRTVFCTAKEADANTIEYALVWKPQPGLLKTYPKLRVIFSLGAGVDHVFADPQLPDVPVVRIVDKDLTARMSEYILLNVLMHHRSTLLSLKNQRNQTWEDRIDPAAHELRVGIMGLGELGTNAANKLAMMGYQVAGWSRSAKNLPEIECFHGHDGLEAFLKRTDILVALLPHTPATEGILNQQLFAKLAKDGPLGGAVLINAGRGKLQRSHDILAALDNGDLIGASLDVFEQEPLASDSPLWNDQRIIITPHNAAVSDPRALCRYIMDQIIDFEAGKPLRNVVDPKTGY
ncbi:MAG: glyoxylate/hydroxypyruvate reductase A [Cohaesibacteraceae bacterium]|nr:glyoxylate/hydroxypyruvate reductase A [Cohaesibacteraceae bacterium]